MVNTLVGRPMQVTTVNGLNKNLYYQHMNVSSQGDAYAAAMAYPLHLLSLRGNSYNLEDPASPDSAMCIRAFALIRSINMYKMYVNAGYVAEFGTRENKVRRIGA